jgi:hypothetical protein
MQKKTNSKQKNLSRKTVKNNADKFFEPKFDIKLPPVIGKMKSSKAADKIASLGDKKTALQINKLIDAKGRDVKFANLDWLFGDDKPAYKYTDHVFGYIPQSGGSANSGIVDITDAGNITPDQNLKNATIKITLDRLRVYDYPGKGLHTILFNFAAQHQVSGGSQDLHFTQNYRVQEGAGAGITGYPVFIGLKLGTEGLYLKCSTVNVSNNDDQKILKFLGNETFKKGLQLIGTVNPVIPVVTEFAKGIVETFAHRHDNVPVQDFYMGLDLSSNPTRAKLKEGSYIAIQVPDASQWDWTKWGFKTSIGQIVSKPASGGVPYNYIVFSISKM